MEFLIAGVFVFLLAMVLILISFLYNYIKGNGELKGLIEQRDKTISEMSKSKKSSEVRLGNLSEQFAPLLDTWEYNPNDFKFLGRPIDGISFNNDSIVFIEIKSGQSGLSQKQRRVKQLVEEGKVEFRVFRVNDKGSGYK